MGGGDNFVLVENLAAKLETRTDPLMVSPNVALRRGKTDAYMGFEYSGESRLFLSVMTIHVQVGPSTVSARRLAG